MTRAPFEVYAVFVFLLACLSLEGDVMNVDECNLNGWCDLDLEPDEFQQLGYRVVEMNTEYYRAVDSYLVFPSRSSGEVARFFAEPIHDPTTCGGLFTTGGTMANLTAILAGLPNVVAKLQELGKALVKGERIPQVTA